MLLQFTGVTDPYEEPTDADVVVDLSIDTPDEACGRILAHLELEGYLVPPTAGTQHPGQPERSQRETNDR